MIRHVSVLTFEPGTDFAPIAAALSELPERLQMESYTFGPDAGIDDGNGTVAVVADFDTVEQYETYRDDPEHRRIIAELIRPHLVARAAVQYEIS